MSKIQSKINYRSVLLSVVLWFVVFNLLMVWFGPVYFADARMAMSFDADGYHAFNYFFDIVVNRHFISPEGHQMGYGMLYFYLCYVVFKILTLGSTDPTLYDLYFSMRFVSIFSFSLVYLLYGFLCVRFRFPRFMGLCLLVVTLLNPSMQIYHYVTKPDALQFCLIVLFFTIFPVVCRNPKRQIVLFASMLCAWIASVKQAGFFMLPMVMMSILVWEMRKSLQFSKSQIVRVIKDCSLTMIVFVMVYLACNPRWIFDFSTTLGWYQHVQQSNWNDAHTFFNPDALTRIFQFGWVIAVGYYVGVLFQIKKIVDFFLQKNRVGQEGSSTVFDEWFIINLFSLSYQICLAILVKDRLWFHYLIPILPVMFLNSFQVYLMLIRKVWKRLQYNLGCGVVCLGIVLCQYPMMVEGVKLIQYNMDYEQHTYTKVGQYLLEHYDPKLSVLSYLHIWVPEPFQNARFFRSVVPDLSRVKPDLFLIKENESVYAGQEEYNRRVEDLKQGRYPDYQLDAVIPDQEKAGSSYLIFKRQMLR